MLAPHLGAGDILIDGGNSHFRDTIRRAHELEAAASISSGFGISGETEGARLGPSIMAGGPAAAWAHVADHFQAIAARHQGAACCAWFGGAEQAGHFAEDDPRGIEYAGMRSFRDLRHAARRPRLAGL